MAPANTQQHFHHIVWPLALGQTLCWAAIFYSFSALFLVWERDLGWSKVELSGAFTLALLVAAFLAPLAGRLIDHGFGASVLTGSALLGAAGLIALSQVTTVWQFYAAYMMLGIAMAGGLYEACFAVLTQSLGDRAKMAITRVTLVAGFAGTLSFPGCIFLESLLGWRMTLWVLAGILVIMVAPLHWYGSHIAQKNRESLVEPVEKHSAQTPAPGIFRNRVFWLLALSFSMLSLNHNIIITHLLPIFEDRQITSSTAVLLASLIGPMQVVGRIMMMAVERHVSSIAIFVSCFLAIAAASLALFGAVALPFLVFGFVFLQGAGAGTTSILKPVTTAELLGRKNFGLIAGMLAVPAQIAVAIAPTVASFIWGIGGYPLVLWFTFATAVMGLVALLAAAFPAQDSRK